MTDQLPTIQQALTAVMTQVRAVAKTDRNQTQNFAFRGIDAVVNAVSPALRDHGVVVHPTVVSHEHGTVEVGKNRTHMAHVVVTVDYTFVGPRGDTLTSRVLGEAMDSGDKCVSKAMSVAFRIALLQTLALPTDEPDPDSESHVRAAPFDLGAWAKTHVTAKAFPDWSTEERREAWLRLKGDGQPETEGEADAVLAMMRSEHDTKETTDEQSDS